MLISDIIKPRLDEAAMKITNGLHPGYLTNMINMINQGTPFSVVAEKHGKYGEAVILDPSMADLLQTALDNSTESGKYLKINTDIRKLQTADGQTILFTELEKTNDIKGGEVDYNVGYIGEIALGVAAGAKFLNAGGDTGLVDLVDLAKKLNMDAVLTKAGKKGSSLQLSYSGTITHGNGKEDNLNLVIKAPGKDVKAFLEFINNKPEAIHPKAMGAMLSALEYARNAHKIAAGLKQTSEDPNTNTIQVVSDGISDQKGTKADLIMEIDGSKINLLSVKTGPSQLGQASGHEWIKQLKFFELVFGLNVSEYEQYWGSSNAEHISALKKIWPLAIAKVSRLTGGDSVRKEAILVKSIANGLIRYANNWDETTGKTETVDIVKLVTDPGSPGYKLMQIDDRLIAAMEKTNLIGWAPTGGMGVNISGLITTTNAKGQPVQKKVALCRMWSTQSGNTVRTNVAGGPLLDELALMTPANAQPVTPQAQAQTHKAKELAKTTPAAPTTPQSPQNTTNLQGTNFVSQEPQQVGTPQEEPEPAMEDLRAVLKNAGLLSS
jgi:hypothetical protein